MVIENFIISSIENGVEGCYTYKRCMCIALFIGYGSKFFLVWGVLGVGCLGLAWLLFHPKLIECLPVWLKRTAIFCILLGSLFFVTIEAQGMQGYLIEAGIAAERIIMEDRSTNTWENLVFSRELLDETNDRVVLVTNNFHVFRATAIARKQGYTQVEGLAADSYPSMIPNNLLREFFGVVKDFLTGNM